MIGEGSSRRKVLGALNDQDDMATIAGQLADLTQTVGEMATQLKRFASAPTPSSCRPTASRSERTSSKSASTSRRES